MNADKVSDCSSDLVCDGDTLRLELKYIELVGTLMIFHFKYHSVRFILLKRKEAKIGFYTNPSFIRQVND